MIVFKTVRWKNLLSTGNNFTEISLNASHTTILLGQSGSGKSTFLDALSFGLFNRPFRNINKNQLVNSINGKNCLVEVEFSIGHQQYLIRRGIKPNIFEILVDNNLINQESHTKDYQQYLERQILKFNFKSFAQIIVLGASNFTPFMQLKPADRRTIIEGLLDIEIFSVMNTLLKQRVSALKSAAQENEYAISLVKEKIVMQEKYLKDLTKDKDDKVKENLSQIESNTKQMTSIEAESETLRASINDLNQKLSFKTELLSQIESIRDIKNKLDTTIKKTNKEILFFEENPSCPTCQQAIPEEFKLHELNKKREKISGWNTGLSDAEVALTKMMTRLQEAKTIEDQIEDLKYRIGKNQSVIDGIAQFIKKMQKDTESLKQQSAVSQEQSDELARLKSELQQLESNKEQFATDRNLQEIATTLLKDGGVKSKIIKQYLPLINKHTNLFLNTMNFFVSFHIDEEFSESIKSRNRDEFSYENFSEGEKQRIDLALLFTWRTIAKMKNSVNTNLLIMDEVLDSYLDTYATENVLNLLNSEMFKDTNIFVISHKDTISDKFKQTIRFEKKKNFSTIE
jgi:DNA repair exonuclease SbcCD ATPase subunit